MQVRVYYEDTDAGGVVFYANYLRFAERGRTKLLRSVGFENKSLLESEGILFVVHHITADYNSPAFLDDLLTVKTAVHVIRNSSFTMKQSVLRGEKSLFDMTVRLVCITKEGRPVRVPDNLKRALGGASI